MDVLEKLMAIRKEKKISREEMTLYVGVNSATLYRYEIKKRKIPFEVIERYADHLGYEIRVLIKNK